MAEKKSNLGIGIVIGAALGAIAATFITPKTGKEMRKVAGKKINKLKKMLDEGELQERITYMYGEVTDESMRIYREARTELIKKIDAVKEEIDDNKYAELVNDVIEQLKTRATVAKDKLVTLKGQLMDEWNEDAEDIEDMPKVKKAPKSKVTNS